MTKEKSEIEIIDDQWGVPTWTKDLAEQIVYLIKNNFAVLPTQLEAEDQ